MFKLYLTAADGRLRPALGPGDLEGYAGTVTVSGVPTGDQAGRWASTVGLAVLRGCDVRRIS